MKDIATPGTGNGRTQSIIQRVLAATVVACATFGGSSHVRQARAEPSAPVIVIHAKRYAFVPAEITLQAGHTVRLVFVSDDVPHSISIPGLQIDVPIVKNPMNQVLITPNETGDFSGECTRYCGAGHDRMTFVVHVLKQSP